MIGTTPADVPDSLMRAACESHARYWRELSGFPRWISRRGRPPGQGVHRCGVLRGGPLGRARRGDGIAAQRQLGYGRGVAGAELRHLHHGGRTSQAGVALRPLHRVQEASGSRCCRRPGRAAPDGGARGTVARQRLRLPDGRSDLSRSGVPVQFFGEPTRLPAGPTKLALGPARRCIRRTSTTTATTA